MKVLIFGGTGAMGEPLAVRLAARGEEVCVTSRQDRLSQDGVRYIQGDAHDMDFVRETLKDGYDVLIDFMNYTLEELRERAEPILSAVGQYIFLSSCRVYMPSTEPITEQTPRLLDRCGDREYLATNEYGLAKAREENIFYAAGKRNWTIVRPALTYNSHRLQLGCYEKEHWLYRALQGRPVVFFEDLMATKSPMTFGGDVAKGIAMLAGNPAALGETVQIVTPETMTWKEIMELYFDEIRNAGGYLYRRTSCRTQREQRTSWEENGG